MKFLRKISIYARRHIDFIVLDCVVYGLAFYAAILLRRTWNIPIRHGDLFLRFGLVGLLVYVLMELIDQNLNGVVSRSMAKEAEALGRHMTISWSVYTVILFLRKDAHLFSRSIYVMTFFACTVGIFIARTIWKAYVKYGNSREALAPKLLVICEAPKAQAVTERLLRGTFENKYELSMIIVHGEGLDYHDHYPLKKGLSHVTKSIRNRQVQAAYVELSDPEEERRVIEQLLASGVIVHRSLGDSTLDFASMRINDLSDRSVITIEDATTSLAKKADQMLVKLRREKGDT